jgi:hypothetical protein
MESSKDGRLRQTGWAEWRIGVQPLEAPYPALDRNIRITIIITIHRV